MASQPRFFDMDVAKAAISPLSTVAEPNSKGHTIGQQAPLHHAPAPRLVVIAGPSGSGKSTLIQRLLSELGKDKIGFSISHTTRPPRPEEQEGINYHFFTDEAFEMAVQNGEFVEHTGFCGYRYGTSKRAVLSVLETGKLCLMQLNMQGVKTLNKLALNPVCIWIEAPTQEELERRIRTRGAGTPEELEEHIEASRRESAQGERESARGTFDYIVVNDDLEKAYEELKTIIEKLHSGTISETARSP